MDSRKSDQIDREDREAPVEVSFYDLVGFVLDHFRWIVSGAAALALLVTAVTVLAPTRYQARASFMPQTSATASRSSAERLAAQLGGTGLATDARFYADLLTTRRVLEAVADSQYAIPSENDTVRGTLADLYGVESPSTVTRRRAAAGRLREDLDVRSSPTEIVELTVRAAHPELAEQIARRLLEQVNEFNLNTRQSQAAAERAFIEERLTATETDLLAAEDSLESFLTSNRQWQTSPHLIFRHEHLQREVARYEALYTNLRQSYEQARVEEVRNTPVITVIETPEDSSGRVPKRLPLKIFGGLLVGAMLGLLAALVLQFWRRYSSARAAPDS